MARTARSTHNRLPPATPRSLLRRGLLLTPRAGVAGNGPALGRPLALAVRRHDVVFTDVEPARGSATCLVLHLQCLYCSAQCL